MGGRLKAVRIMGESTVAAFVLTCNPSAVLGIFVGFARVSLKNFFKGLFNFERESASGEGAESEGDRGSKAGCILTAESLMRGSELMNHETVT